MNTVLKSFIFCSCLVLFFTDCQNKNKVYDTPLSGRINISVDESFKPVIAEQIKVYQSSYPNTQIVANYEPEADCFRDLENDSTRMIIVSRGLSDEESEYYKAKLSFKPQWDILAFDAVDVIVNIRSKDSVYTLGKLKSYLNGDDTGKLVVVDGRSQTSKVRLLRDSLLNGKQFGKNVFATADSKEVVNYIAQNSNAIGFVGSSWVGDFDDPEQVAYKDKIRFALIECRICDKGVYAKPSQATIAQGEYPLVRPLYFILKENANGLGTGFVNYMSLERGQLVFRRSYLVPAKIDFTVRKSMMESNKDLLK